MTHSANQYWQILTAGIVCAPPAYMAWRLSDAQS